MSKVLSWLPTTTTVFFMEDRGRNSSAVTGPCGVNPSILFGIRIIPSAWVRVVIHPAPRGRGVATILLPTAPSFTRINSSTPSFEAIFFVGSTVTVGLCLSGCSSIIASNGPTNCSKAIIADTGYPGIPKMGLSFIAPMMSGFPGIMVTPWTSTRPRSSITVLV